MVEVPPRTLIAPANTASLLAFISKTTQHAAGVTARPVQTQKGGDRLDQSDDMSIDEMSTRLTRYIFS